MLTVKFVHHVRLYFLLSFFVETLVFTKSKKRKIPGCRYVAHIHINFWWCGRRGGGGSIFNLTSVEKVQNDFSLSEHCRNDGTFCKNYKFYE